MKEKILVINHDMNELLMTKMFLQKNHYSVITCKDSFEAIRITQCESPHLVIVGKLSSQLSCEELCQEIKKNTHIPILMLTSEYEEDILNCFKFGADDYIIKPFGSQLLNTQVDAILKRVHKLNNKYQSYNNNDLVIDLENCTVTKNGRISYLTPIEFKIVSFLTSNLKVVTRDELHSVIYKDKYTNHERSIDSHIKNIRIKMDHKPPVYIKTIYGIGFKFCG